MNHRLLDYGAIQIDNIAWVGYNTKNVKDHFQRY